MNDRPAPRLLQRNPSPLHPAVNIHTLPSGDHMSGFMAGLPSAAGGSTPNPHEFRRRSAAALLLRFTLHPSWASAMFERSAGVLSASTHFHCGNSMLPRLIFLLASLSGILVGGCASETTAAGSAHSLRLLTYNIHLGQETDGSPSLSEIATVLKGSDADVILLQEVYRYRNGLDQLTLLADATGYHAIFGPMIDQPQGEMGMAVLSRLPILIHEYHPLPQIAPLAGTPHQQGFQRVVLQVGRGQITVLNLHLDPRGDEYRIPQSDSLISLAAAWSDMPVFIGGDLNSFPSSPVLAQLTGQARYDALSRCGDKDAATFPAENPVYRFDYVLVPEGVRCISAEVVDTRASDHRPVLVSTAL